MILSDFHVHTRYCDGKNSPEEIIIEAISRGMKKLGFSGHSYTSFDEEPCMSIAGTERYKAEINALKEKYASQIKIFCGTEQDYYSDFPAKGFDYVIGSVHYVLIDGEYICVEHTDEIFTRLIHACHDDVYEAAEKYFALVADVVRKTNADIIGHFDVITRLNRGNKFFDENNPRYVAAWTSAVDELLKTGKPFEINIGGVARGYKDFPYPSRPILKYIAEHGGSVILSSDAHVKENLMYKFPEYEELALSMGLKIVEL